MDSTLQAGVNEPVRPSGQRSTSVSDAVQSRRAVRAFLDDPVPLEVLRRVMDKARLSPSGCNFQPWEAAIRTGEPLRALQAEMARTAPQDPIEYEIQPKDFPRPGPQMA